jgi:hypothetical protein
LTPEAAATGRGELEEAAAPLAVGAAVRGRAAARAAAEPVFWPWGSAAAVGGTGMPSGMLSLVAGEPVSTPAGMALVWEPVGGKRRGGLRSVCCAAAHGTSTPARNATVRDRAR